MRRLRVVGFHIPRRRYHEPGHCGKAAQDGDAGGVEVDDYVWREDLREEVEAVLVGG